MPHGTPDWGSMGPKHVVYGLDDLGEHAVRVGCPSLWDRRGDVVCLTDFREGLGVFDYGFFGTNSDVRLCTGHSRHGAYSVKLRSGDQPNSVAYLGIRLPFQDPSAIGLEFSFSLAPETQTVEAFVDWYDGTRNYQAGASYSYLSSSLGYWTSAGSWGVLLSDVVRGVSSRPEHTLKLVVDMTLGTYVRCLLDELAIDMRGTAVHEGPLVGAPYWYFQIAHYGQLGLIPDCYVDSVVVTQNEPV